MLELPIQIAVFSPKIGGIECYAILKADDNFHVIAAHLLPQYSQYIGEFKKPGIGMLVVIADILSDFKLAEMVFIGDSWYDKKAAHSFGIPFIEVKTIHNLASNTDFSNNDLITFLISQQATSYNTEL